MSFPHRVRKLDPWPWGWEHEAGLVNHSVVFLRTKIRVQRWWLLSCEPGLSGEVDCIWKERVSALPKYTWPWASIWPFSMKQNHGIWLDWVLYFQQVLIVYYSTWRKINWTHSIILGSIKYHIWGQGVFWGKTSVRWLWIAKTKVFILMSFIKRLCTGAWCLFWNSLWKPTHSQETL